MDFTTTLSNIANWEFLNEELWRWAIFFGAMVFISMGWNGVLDLMR